MKTRFLLSILQVGDECAPKAGVEYKKIAHVRTHASEESARVHGEWLAVGAKALSTSSQLRSGTNPRSYPAS